MDFASRIANVHLDEEFGPLEELLTSSKVGYLNFLRVLKLCWELVDQKSEEKNTEEFKENCDNELGKFLCEQYCTTAFGFLGKNLMDNLRAGRSGSQILSPERCAYHYTTIRSLLRSAHYGEEPPSGDERLERAYYDFTLVFCPFMNRAAQAISSGHYLKKDKINPSTHKDIIVDSWEMKCRYWGIIETILNNHDWDQNKIRQLHDLFLKTIQNPETVDSIYRDDRCPRKWIEYLLGEFLKYVGTRRYALRWRRLYSGAYMDDNRIETIKKNGRNPDIYDCNNGSPMVKFMYSILWRTINQMNSTNFKMFSLSTNPLIDLYKYCPVQSEHSTASRNLNVWGEKVREFTFFPSGKIVQDSLYKQQEDKSSNARTLHLVYAPVNAIWRSNRPQNAISFYQFIAEWVMKVIAGEKKPFQYSLKQLLCDYEFSFEIYSEQLRKDKNLLIELKKFASGANLVQIDRTSAINWQNLLYHSWNTTSKDNLRLQYLVGQDEEVVSSSVCFCEDEAIYIKEDADVPENFDPKISYIVEFTHDDFVGFLMGLYQWKEKLDKSFRHFGVKEQMKALKINFDYRSSYDTKKQKIMLQVWTTSINDIIAEFPITINRRSRKDCWHLTKKDELKVKEAVMDALWEQWDSLTRQKETRKKHEFICLVMQDGGTNSREKFRNPSGKIYEGNKCDSEIILLKQLVFR